MSKRRPEPTTQDLIDSVDTLRESVDDLTDKVDDLTTAVGHLINTADPEFSGGVRALLDAAAQICEALGQPRPKTASTPRRRQPRK